MIKKVELLAPAGNYESFLGAIHAGADAVYLGGDKFGARAFAENFSSEELCHAIRYAHLFNRKIYLTVNTLIKEDEFSQLHDYLSPFYQEGLDGVIIQDLGVFQYIKTYFPKMELHVSTQMTITGKYGAKLLKDMGASRIVPARELSLPEIVEIKEQTGIEIESFIHGAMCYCYSGQCLFSSIVGGRSGNRGKCAQPCRLPYQIIQDNRELTNEQCYPLSLKDMCTIQNIPEFIEAGIDSFKIEGRMKKPEYVAGVTAIYRHYIDLYYENGSADYRVSDEDIKKLSSLYIRSEIQDGYCHKHNGKDMITLNRPGYSASDDTLLLAIREKYLSTTLKLPIDMFFQAKLQEKLSLTLKAQDKTVTVFGSQVEKAQKQPVTKENIRKQLLKLGDTCFECKECEIESDEDIFIPLKEINELRRQGIQELEDAILNQNHDTFSNREVCPAAKMTAKVEEAKGQIYVFVTSLEQFKAVSAFDGQIDRLYLDADMVIQNPDILKNASAKKEGAGELFLALPYIIRKADYPLLEQYKNLLLEKKLTGCLVRNLDELGFLNAIGYTGKVASDAGVYMFNQQAIDALAPQIDTFCLPYELNRHEKKCLKGEKFEQIIYGRIPMMISANCIKKTGSSCDHRGSILYLKDRYKNRFPVSTVCTHCYNIIWNSVPLSLHNAVPYLRQEAVGLRVQFSIETEREAADILQYYLSIIKEPQKNISLPFTDYTTGHEKRGVE